MLRLGIEGGRTLGVTPDHGLDVFRDGEWVRVEAKDIGVLDWLRTPTAEVPNLSRWGATSGSGVPMGQWHLTQVTHIERYQGPSVCVEVPEGHQFLQNGFCGWNCQGQEFDNIILPLTLAQGPMLQRNLLYTAVTRAKHQVWILGEKPALERAIANNQVVFRRTRLGARIEQAIAAGNSSARG